MNTLQAALDLAELGYPVFPCVPNSKAPAVAGGFKSATTDTGLIREWWSTWPDANLAIATAGLLVLDIDGDDNPWPPIEEQRASLLECGALALTPRGGRHYVFRQPEGKAWRNTGGTLAPKVDTRADGGYILVAPSTFNGRHYTWIDGMELSCRRDTLPVPPEWLVLALDGLVKPAGQKAQPQASGGTATHSGRAGGASGGDGDNWRKEIERDFEERTTWAEILEPHGWVDVGELKGGLRAWRRPGKEDGHSATAGVRSSGNDVLHVFSANAVPLMADRTYGKFRTYAILNHGGSLVQAAEELRRQGYGRQEHESEPEVDLSGLLGSMARRQEGADDEEDSPLYYPVDPGPFPEHLLHVPGFIGEVVAHMLATARRRQPVLSLAAAVSLMAALVGRKVRDRSGTRPNLYTLGLAPSGSGKDHPRQVCKAILTEAGCSDLIGPEGIASAQALARAVHDHPSCLALMDEFGKVLSLIAGASKSPFLAAIPSLLLKLYSSSGGIWKADTRADRDNDFEVNQPCLTIYGTSVAESVLTSLTADSITDGLLGRFLLLEGEKGLPRLQRVTETPLPPCVLSAATAWSEFTPGGDLGAIHPIPAIVPATDDAEALLDQFAELCDRYAEEAGYPYGALWARAFEKAQKLALLAACSVAMDRPEDALIDADCVRWGCDMSEYITRRMIFLSNDWISKGKYDSVRLQILRVIREAGKTGITGRDLCRKTQFVQSRERAEVINALIEAGEILHSTFQKGGLGRPKNTYVCTNFKRASIQKYSKR